MLETQRTPPTIISRARLSLVECPRWHDQQLWFANWGPGEIRRQNLDGTSEVVVSAPAPPLSFDFLPDGRMVVVAAGERRLLRREVDGALVSHSELSAFPPTGWNEIVVDGRGNLYVNGGNLDPEVDGRAPGVIVLVKPDGSARQVADDLAFPNGMAVTPDNATLIVAESWRGRLTSFAIASDGGLSGRRVWAQGGAPDGICVDSEGACWFADVGAKKCVRVAEGGRILDELPLDRGAFACVLGGPDGRTLYITAAEWFGMDRMSEMVGTGQVLAAPASAPGVGWP
jgi:sugar lactone lactonase YvrE